MRSIIQEERNRLNNYHVLAQRGLSTAFTRSFFSNPSGNGSLVTIQEISGGLLKRGLVDVVLDTQGTHQEIFTVSLAMLLFNPNTFYLLDFCLRISKLTNMGEEIQKKRLLPRRSSEIE